MSSRALTGDMPRNWKAMTIRLVVLVLAFACMASNARADYVPADQAAPQIVRFLPVARAAWPDSPCAGREQIAVADLGDMADGEAFTTDVATTCQVTINARLLTAPPMAVCEVLTHELGHLALGTTYFAAVNPADPAHSPDQHSIMYRDASAANYAPCAAAVGGHALAYAAEFALMARVHPRSTLWEASCRPGRLAGEALCRSTGWRYRVTTWGGAWRVNRYGKIGRRTTKARHRAKR